MTSAVDPLPGQRVSAERRIAVPWVVVGWVLALLILCYFPVLQRLVRQWEQDPDVGHGFFVPLVAAYIMWQRREEVLAIPRKPNYWGIVILLFAAAELLVGTLGVELFLQRTAFLLSLVGTILLVGGNQVLRALAFPVFLMLFMIPIPAVIYSQITFPLQLFASRVAEMSLSALGIPVFRDGNILELASQKLSVVEACSGIRSLLSLTFLSLVYAYFFDRKVWMRWVLLVAVIPIAILANSGRVTMTGIISEWRPDLAQGFFHSLEGWIIFLIAIALMILTHSAINFVYRMIRGRSNA